MCVCVCERERERERERLGQVRREIERVCQVIIHKQNKSCVCYTRHLSVYNIIMST